MPDAAFEQLLSLYYRPLYQFAYSLTRVEADAADLTQQTFYLWASKGHQLRDQAKVKTWLFTTLHREFLNSRRRQARFPHFSIETADEELPVIEGAVFGRMDCEKVLEALGKVDESFQAAVALFYLEDCSYKEIAEILDVPIGTVKSRLARGLIQLQRLLMTVDAGKPASREAT